MSEPQFIDDLERLDFERITRWLAASYWSPGIERARVEQGARHSSVASGIFLDGQLVGFGRVVSDTTRFAYICDVIVDENWRRRGLASALVRHFLQHPRLKDVENWYLLTADAQAVYSPLGFAEYCRPDRTLMSLHRTP